MGNNSSISLEVDAGDMLRIEQQMVRARRELGVSLPHSINMASRAILNSLGASTKVSQQYRTFRDTGKKSRSGQNKRFEVWTRYSTPKRKGKATRASWQGPFRWQPIYAKNAAQLKKRPALIIVMRGLAKASFGQAMKKGNFGFPKAAIGPGVKAKNLRIMLKAAHRWVAVTKRLTGNYPFFKMVNNLRHIMPALRNGPQTVDSAIARAADGMEKNITKQIERQGFK